MDISKFLTIQHLITLKLKYKYKYDKTTRFLKI